MDDYKRELDDKEKVECAKGTTVFTHESKLQAVENSFNVSLEFVRLEVQIATLLFVFIGLFLDAFGGGGSLNLFWAKVALATAVFFLIGSLVMGLLQLKREERFFDELVFQRVSRFGMWSKAVARKVTFEEAEQYHEGSKIGAGNVIKMPIWTWVLQTIFLGIGIALLFMLFLIFLFI